MFKAEHPEYMIYLLSIGLVWLIWFASRWMMKKRRARLGDSDSMDRISYQVMPSAQWIRPVLLSIALAFAVLALVNPQWGRKKEKVKVSSSDVFIALDISTSMLCEDVKPSRLERARLFSDRLVDRLRGERIGLVLFAGGAYTQVPLTTDYSALKLFLSSVDPKLAATQGTNFAEALKTCMTSFPSEDKRPGAIILITDGENHELGDIEAAKNVRQAGYSVYTVGVGTESGGMIPIQERGRIDYKRDNTGAPITTSLNKQSIVSIASAGGGKSFLIGEGSRVFDEIESDIENMEKTESEQLSFAEYVSYYQYFLGISILSFLLSFLTAFRQKV